MLFITLGRNGLNFEDIVHSLGEIRGFFFHTLFFWDSAIVLDGANFQDLHVALSSS